MQQNIPPERLAEVLKIPYLSIIPHLISIGFARVSKDEWNWQNVSSPFVRLYYVTEGSATISIADGPTLHLEPGRLYCIPHHCRHSCQCLSDNFGHYYLHFYEEVNTGPSIFDILKLPYEVEGADVYGQLFETLSQEFADFRLSDYNPQHYDTVSGLNQKINSFSTLFPCQQMRIQGFILMLISIFMSHSTVKPWTDDKRLSRVLNHIHGHLDQDIPIEHLAHMACLTTSSLARVFQKELHTTPLQYINRKRIERAQLLLFTTRQTIQQIGYSVGFSNASYFVRLFRKQTGMTPQIYRNTTIHS